MASAFAAPQQQYPPMAPPVLPRRHPSRLTITTTDSEEFRRAMNGLTNEHIDLWERAVVRHHTMDYYGSADMFLQLSKSITSELESTLCLLNAGMIHSRLGNFKFASEILDQAARVDETLSLTLFGMGNVEFQCGHIAKAKDCWQIALNHLDDQSRRYSHIGLDYELSPAAIEHNLDLLWSKDTLAEKASQLAGVPRDLLFEAPIRAVATPASEKSSHSLKPKTSSSGSRGSVEAGITALPFKNAMGEALERSDTRPTLKSIEYARENVVLHPPLQRPGVQRRVSTSKGQTSSTGTFGNLMKQWQAHRRQSSALRYGDWTFRQEVEKDTGAYKPATPIPTMPPVPAQYQRAVAGPPQPMPMRQMQAPPFTPQTATRPPPPPAPPVLNVTPHTFTRGFGIKSKTPSPPPPPLSGHVEIVSPQEIADFFRRTRNTTPVNERNPSPQTQSRPDLPALVTSSQGAQEKLPTTVYDDDASVYSDDEDSSRHDSMVSDETPESKSQPQTPSTPYMGNLSYSDSLRAAYSTSSMPTHQRPQYQDAPSPTSERKDSLPYYGTAPLYPEPSGPLPPIPARSASRRKVSPVLPRIQELEHTPATHPALRHPNSYFEDGGMF